MWLRKETVAAFVYLASAFYFMAIFQVWADESNTGVQAVLPDVGFQVLPQITNFVIVDVYVHLFFAVTLVRVLFTENSQTAYRRMMWVMGTLYLLRSFTISFTVLPTPYEGCELWSESGGGGSHHHHQGPFSLALKIITLQHTTCGDVLYSGHTMVLTTSAVLWHVYTVSLAWKVVAWLVTIVGMVIIVATHFHYTDDVLIAFILTLLAYFVYHWGLWIGRVHRCGAKVPFGFVGDMILLADGTDQHRFCSPTCRNIQNRLEVVGYPEHLIVTPPPRQSHYYYWWRGSFLNRWLNEPPEAEMRNADVQALCTAVTTYDPQLAEHLDLHIGDYRSHHQGGSSSIVVDPIGARVQSPWAATTTT